MLIKRVDDHIGVLSGVLSAVVETAESGTSKKSQGASQFWSTGVYV